MKDITWSCWFTVVIVSTTFCCLLDECLGLKLCPASHDSQKHHVPHLAWKQSDALTASPTPPKRSGDTLLSDQQKMQQGDNGSSSWESQCMCCKGSVECLLTNWETSSNGTDNSSVVSGTADTTCRAQKPISSQGSEYPDTPKDRARNDSKAPETQVFLVLACPVSSLLAFGNHGIKKVSGKLDVSSELFWGWCCLAVGFKPFSTFGEH